MQTDTGFRRLICLACGGQNFSATNIMIYKGGDPKAFDVLVVVFIVLYRSCRKK